MVKGVITSLTAAALALGLGVSGVSAQDEVQLPSSRSLAGGVNLQSYNFAAGTGATSASLLLMPVAFQQPMGRLLFEAYAAYAIGHVDLDGSGHTFSSPTDTWVRTSYTLGNATVVTLGLNLPTGTATHDEDQAIVATVLSTGLLGFREASWGIGFAGTAGISTAVKANGWDMTLGASYRQNDGFRPRADTATHYSPGDEMRFRVAAGRTQANGNVLSLGLALMNYTKDRLDNRNLFQAGVRAMADASYAFGWGSTAMSVYGADIWRGSGDVTLPIVSQASTVRKDSVYSIGNQNIAIVGVSATVPMTAKLNIRPGMDFRYQKGAEQGADGWILGAGADVPLVAAGLELFPSARGTYGRIENADGVMKRLWGTEFGLVLRRARTR